MHILLIGFPERISRLLVWYELAEAVNGVEVQALALRILVPWKKWQGYILSITIILPPLWMVLTNLKTLNKDYDMNSRGKEKKAEYEISL